MDFKDLQQLIEIDTLNVVERVRHYLKANQIQYSVFGRLVLGVSQGRLSILLAKPKPWSSLAHRVRQLYARMQLWMDTRATYGNNPYMKIKRGSGEARKRARSGVATSEIEMRDTTYFFGS